MTQTRLKLVQGRWRWAAMLLAAVVTLAGCGPAAGLGLGLGSTSGLHPALEALKAKAQLTFELTASYTDPAITFDGRSSQLFFHGRATATAGALSMKGELAYESVVSPFVFAIFAQQRVYLASAGSSQWLWSPDEPANVAAALDPQPALAALTAGGSSQQTGPNSYRLAVSNLRLGAQLGASDTFASSLLGLPSTTQDMVIKLANGRLKSVSWQLKAPQPKAKLAMSLSFGKSPAVLLAVPTSASQVSPNRLLVSAPTMPTEE